MKELGYFDFSVSMLSVWFLKMYVIFVVRCGVMGHLD